MTSKRAKPGMRVRRGLRAACNAALASFQAAADGSGDVSVADAERIEEALAWLDSLESKPRMTD